MVVNDSLTLVDASVIGHPPPEVVDEEYLRLAGRYQLLHPLGSGGMGNVYLAEDLLLSRRVAIKTVRPELSANPEVRLRIQRECRLHAAIGTHPHIITLFDTFEENGHIYLVMEYFAGKTLASRLAAEANGARIGVPGALDIVHQLLLALKTIHETGIVHRDIKTANILVAQRDRNGFLAKLTDFGIARTALEDDNVSPLTALDVQAPGTPTYMAPERIDPQSFGPVGPTTDLYAVGLILYELLAGRPPFRGTMTEIFSGHLVQPPDLSALPQNLPEQISRIVQTALAKQPAQRFADARSFIEAVETMGAIISDQRVNPENTGYHPICERSGGVADSLAGDGVGAIEPGEGKVLAAAGSAISLTEDQTLLASLATEITADETQLHPRLAQKRADWLVPKHMAPWMGGMIVILILLAMAFLFLGETGVEKLPPQPEKTGVSSVLLPSEPESTSPAQDSPPGQPVASALKTLERVRQEKSIESATLTERTRTTEGEQWQVIENSSRKIR